MAWRSKNFGVNSIQNILIYASKNATTEQVQNAFKKLKKRKIKKPVRKGNVRKFFGANTNETDGLKFQKKVRSEWD